MAQVCASSRFHIFDSQLPRAACKTTDGAVIVAGDGANDNSPTAGILIRTLTINQPWQRSFSGSYARSLRAVTELSDGNLAAGGYSFFSEYAGDERFWVLKLDPQGIVIWEKEFGGTDEQNDVNAIAPAPDGGFVVAGLKLSHSGEAKPQTWVIRLDANGTQVWQQVFDGGITYAIVASPDGSYALFGAQPIAGSLDSFLWGMKIDANGTELWSHVYDDLRVSPLIEAGATAAEDGGYVVVGNRFARKVDAAGNPVWLKEFPFGWYRAAATLTDGTFLLSGDNVDYYNCPEAYVANLSTDGQTVLWDNCDMLVGTGASAVLAGIENTTIIAGWVPIDNLNNDIFVCILRPPGAERTLAAKESMGSGTFLDMLNQAAMIVKSKYPAAQFYEADLNIARPGSPWQFVFNVPSGGNGVNGTAFLDNYMGRFQLPPRFVSQPWLEDVIIRLPISLDLAEAKALAEKAGYTGQITNIVLRHPLYPGVIEPSYIFKMPSRGEYVFVGVNSRKVTTQPIGKS